MAVISAEKLRDYIEGPAETTNIAEVLMNNDKMSQYVIAEETWDCIWTELIVKGKGLKTVKDRPNAEAEYNFSEEMLEEMIHELDRVITKYSSDEWNTKTTSNRLVELLSEHRVLVQEELDEVQSGRRRLTARDMLGPKERQRRQLMAQEEAKKSDNEPNEKNMSDEIWKKEKDYSEYFQAVERDLLEKRRETMRIEAISKGR